MPPGYPTGGFLLPSVFPKTFHCRVGILSGQKKKRGSKVEQNGTEVEHLEQSVPLVPVLKKMGCISEV
jgi:hypothetical protein